MKATISFGGKTIEADLPDVMLLQGDPKLLAEMFFKPALCQIRSELNETNEAA